jgi:hypothetical protein
MVITPYSDQYWPSLAEFLVARYPGMPLKGDRLYFQWRFAENPLGSALEKCFLAVDDERVVGQACTIRDRLWDGNAWCDCYWLVDLMVSPEHRRGMAGIELFQAAMSACPTLLSVGFTHRTSVLHRGLKWQRGPSMTSRFVVVRPSRLAAIAQSSARSNAFAAAALRLSDRIVGPLQAAKTQIYRLRPQKLKVEVVDRFDARFDEIVERALDWNMIQPFRGSAYLTWKFGSRPCGAHFTLVAREPGSSGIRGYMVVKLKSRPRLARWADIADFVVRPDDTVAFRSLLNEAIGRAISCGVDFVRIRYSGAWQIPPGIRPIGIRRERPVDAIAYHSNVLSVATQLNQRSWALTGIVSDLMDHGADEWDLCERQ